MINTIDNNQMATAKSQVKKCLLQVLEDHPEGIQYAKLISRLSELLPDIPVNTIHGSTWELTRKKPLPGLIQPARGLYQLEKYRDRGAEPVPDEKLPKEEEFYERFREWLELGPEGCTRAIKLGGSKFGGKWGTPDVIGRVSSQRGDIVAYPDIIISAEIKTDPNQLITAFGQACAYKLFSHKSYLVIPSTSKQEDVLRLESLCLLIQIGLVLFDISDAKQPKWDVHLRPVLHQPDMAALNENLNKIKDDLYD